MFYIFLTVIHVPTVGQRVQCSQGGCLIAGLQSCYGSVGTVAIANGHGAVTVSQANHIALTVQHIIVCMGAVGHGEGLAPCVADIHHGAVVNHPDQLVAGIEILVGIGAVRPAGAQTVGVVGVGPGHTVGDVGCHLPSLGPSVGLDHVVVGILNREGIADFIVVVGTIISHSLYINLLSLAFQIQSDSHQCKPKANKQSCCYDLTLHCLSFYDTNTF